MQKTEIITETKCPEARKMLKPVTQEYRIA
jgi:hypothetical protein